MAPFGVLHADDLDSKGLLCAARAVRDGLSHATVLQARTLQEPTVATIDTLGLLYGDLAQESPQYNLVPDLSAADEQSEPEHKGLGAVYKACQRGGSTLHLEQCGSAATVGSLEVPLAEPDASLVVQGARIVPESAAGQLCFRKVALGGTFDRLHAGHRLLLAAASLVTTQDMFVGIADDKLLEGKGLQERIQPYADREANVAAFVSSCKRSIRCQTGPLRDPEEPTLAETDAGVEALVASEETVKGGLKINEGRAKRGFAPLVLVVVPVIGAMSGDSKLSSTSLRRQELEAEQAVR